MKEAYLGHKIFEALIFFINTCEFFEWFDFISLKRNVEEVSDAVRHSLLQEQPEEEVLLMWKIGEYVGILVKNYLPHGIQEATFNFGALIGLFYIHQIAIVKKIGHFFMNRMRSRTDSGESVTISHNSEEKHVR